MLSIVWWLVCACLIECLLACCSLFGLFVTWMSLIVDWLLLLIWCLVCKGLPFVFGWCLLFVVCCLLLVAYCLLLLAVRCVLLGVCCVV